MCEVKLDGKMVRMTIFPSLSVRKILCYHFQYIIHAIIQSYISWQFAIKFLRDILLNQNFEH